jgi:hypothetical protein
MADIFRVDENDLPWVEYKEFVDAGGRAGVRVKALTVRDRAVPPDAVRLAAQRRSWALIVS